MKSEQYRRANGTGGLRQYLGMKVMLRWYLVRVVALTLFSEVRGDAGLRPPPVRPRALILPGRREERKSRKSLRQTGRKDAFLSR